MELKEFISRVGIITLKKYDQTSLSEEDRSFNKSLLAKRNDDPAIMLNYRFGRLVQSETVKNVISNAGLEVINQMLCIGEAYAGTGKINKMALGTGAGTPNAGDAALFAEDYRNNTISGTVVGNKLYLTAVFTETECSGTFTEFGNFIDGEAGADTGALWSHIAGLNWGKTLTEALVVSCEYTSQSV